MDLASARSAAVGAGCGLAATGAMTGAMLAWQRWAGGGRIGPAVVTDRLLRAVHLEPTQAPTRRTVEGLAHFGFGTALGGVYGVLAPQVLRQFPALRRVPAPVRGATFAVGVWCATYGTTIPAVGLVPPPGQDTPRRQPRLVAAHVVYGAALGALLQRAVPAECSRGHGR